MHAQKEGPANALAKYGRKGKTNKQTKRSSSKRIQAPEPGWRTRRHPAGPPTSRRRLGSRAPARREPQSPRADPAGPALLTPRPGCSAEETGKGAGDLSRFAAGSCGPRRDTAGGWDVCTPERGASSAHKARQEIKSWPRPPPPKQRLRAQALPGLTQ